MELAFLHLKIPKENERGPRFAEAALSGIAEVLKPVEGIVSLELLFQEKFLYFYIVTSKKYLNFIKGQLFSQYPSLEIDQAQDYTKVLDNERFAGVELCLSKVDLYPIKTYPHLEIDPLSHIAGIFAGFSKEEKGWIQILTKVVNKDSLKFRLTHFLRSSFRKRFRSGTEEYLKMLDKAEEEKFAKPLFRTKIRLLCITPSISRSRLQVQALASSFKHLSTPHLNSFKIKRLRKDKEFLREYRQRRFLGKSYFLNSEELATFFHLPYKGAEIPQVVKIKAKRAEPPVNLPKEKVYKPSELSLFAETTFRNEQIRFGIKRKDRRRHIYAVGKTGVGKTKFLELLALEDIIHGKGVAILDPHGDLAEEILKYIPLKRIYDVVYFNPTDTEYPIGFNPMEQVKSFEYKQNIVAGFIGIFKKLLGWNWNQRLEHVLRYTTLALLDCPNSTVLGITRMLTDNLFRQRVISQIHDPLVKKFWTTEFASWSDQFANEAIVPIINKVGQFVASPLIRNIVGQPKSGFDLSEVMNNEKILIANLSIGKLGEENSNLLGSMLVTKIWQKALERASIPEEERKDFYVYIDEFQNFATSAFANILSEARKYHLCLNLAHQYIKQLPEEVQSTIFGNIGSIVSFRVGGEDAAVLEKEFAPTFSASDLMNLDVREIYVKMSIDGQTAPPFSARTIDFPRVDEDYSQEVIAFSQRRWAKPKSEVEKEIEKFEKGSPKGKIGKEEKKSKFPEPLV